MAYCALHLSTKIVNVVVLSEFLIDVESDVICCLDVDRRKKFCFVEYDTDTAAQKAVDAENGRDFKGAKLGINYTVSQKKLCQLILCSLSVKCGPISI